MIKFKQFSKLKKLTFLIALGAVSCQEIEDESIEVSKKIVDPIEQTNTNERLHIACRHQKFTASEKASENAFFESFSKSGNTLSARIGRNANAIPSGKNTVNVVFHFLFNAKMFPKSKLNGTPWSTAQKQINLLNAHFSGKKEGNNRGIPPYWNNRDARINLRFKLAGIREKWVKDDYKAENNGNYVFNDGGSKVVNPHNTLNIHVVPSRSYLLDGKQIYGSAKSPWESYDSKKHGDRSHIVIIHTTNPDWTKENVDTQYNFNKGMTTVHEVGHFFGLKHVFNETESCSDKSNGDGVWDTPKQNTPSYASRKAIRHKGKLFGWSKTESELVTSNKNGVVTRNSSCTGKPVMFQNIMDYSPDKYKVMFTKGQRNVVRRVVRIKSRRNFLR